MLIWRQTTILISTETLNGSEKAEKAPNRKFAMLSQFVWTVMIIGAISGLKTASESEEQRVCIVTQVSYVSLFSGPTSSSLDGFSFFFTLDVEELVRLLAQCVRCPAVTISEVKAVLSPTNSLMSLAQSTSTPLHMPPIHY